MAGKQLCIVLTFLAVSLFGQATRRASPSQPPKPPTPPPPQAGNPRLKAHLSAVRPQVTVVTSLLGDITAVLFEYQKMVGKESREDSKLASKSKVGVVATKSGKLENDKNLIARQMEEAQKKAQSQMDAAEAALVTGIASGALQYGGGTGSGWDTQASHLRTVLATLKGLKPKVPGPPGQIAPGLDLPALTDRYVKLKTRAETTAKRVDDELRKK
jgi:hypothetical protein